jgi:D-alanine transaminase
VSDKTLIAYLDGSFLPLDQARVSVMDRGFLFGDGVYEMMPVYGDIVFRLDEHLQRLARSLEAIDIPNPYGPGEWKSLVGELLGKNAISGHKSIYIEVTRGEDDRNHIYESARLVPTVFMLCQPLAARNYSDGVSAITHPDIRWDYCHIKAISLLPAVMLKQRASKAGSLEAILLRNGEVTEGAASNVFIVRDERIMTPPRGNELLHGITRDLVIELLTGAGIACAETRIGEQELRSADEIWITSSTMEVVPVVTLDGRSVGRGVPGPQWRRARDLYDSFKLEAPVTGVN